MKLSDKITGSVATNFLKKTRDYLISDPALELGISQILKDRSRDNDDEPNQNFPCANDTINFTPYQNIRTQRKQTNEGMCNRTIQIYNASLEITTAVLKPFLRRYGELEENGVYVTRCNPYQPNKQIFYADAFYGHPILWVYNEMLYVTLMELSLDKREERRAFCAKLNGLPSNANAREY
ncbi:hypothetical protein GLOIN_2v1771009 [Rhizophagus irregularis DAOM 181602=DAOM 197198]|uniref:Uncharacterized protein n=3 Tax=Rhizophagus irregularis TaxID=588596 RepID=A0A015KUL5_RHIIW|nr:hypothetical protein GLOIN_2v1771009 [Rhizophagus irregularis DAOM 181602=DAOM 197198]EXX71309.1 hypothetical protein RirG_079630 [Rhizophagus irregularis DAOM 197198w]POG74753.1 hypothetical protein GLOIN_2v1771009 [Rhizophagus irregularis DAOM 181602=DAOM 197198]GBC31623.2 hypothetical protein GLOIN_2v1771009 [Rhizophagus irregularis DAOM 181602=DAOM 197198]|eukprot:XP_025181619.1 hypothetical protein GLOIN_2v1771009 [Rhizophagus irregularis DAOM 181602=DAOM 197198]